MFFIEIATNPVARLFAAYPLANHGCCSRPRKKRRFHATFRWIGTLLERVL